MVEPLTRDRPIVKGRAALLIIDVQNGTFGPAQAKSKPEFHTLASTRVIPNISRLLEAFRGGGLVGALSRGCRRLRRWRRAALSDADPASAS